MDREMMGRIYLTSDNHDPEKSNELCFQKGDLVTLVSELLEDGQHYQAMVADGSMGVIHSSLLLQREPVQLLPMPWFHSSISRLDAEKLLDRNRDGQFLLRTSQNIKGVFALAISHKEKIRHYLVAMDFTAKKLTINGEKYYNNLPELVKLSNGGEVEDYIKVSFSFLRGFGNIAQENTTTDILVDDQLRPPLDMSHQADAGTLGITLTHPVVRRGILDFHIDQDTLKSMWGLPKENVEFGQSLGKGEFGEVCMAVYRGVQVAGKVIHEDKQNAANMANFLKEAAILTHLAHKNLVQLVGLVFQGSAMKYILTELMGTGSLQKYLISRGRSVITQDELLSFSRDVCDGMVYISSQGFVHRDLAARNVLLNNNGQAKISDFGLARKAEIHVPHEGGKFPIKWTAPEALKESKFSVKSDVWSYGVLLWEIYSYGRNPYPSVPTSEVLENIEDGVIMDPPDTCPDEIYDLMCLCWEMEPNLRPSFSHLQRELVRTFRDSQTPSISPMMVHKTFPMPNVDELLNGPIAFNAYRDAPLHRKTTMFLGEILFTGSQGSGKTSLLRSLMGKNFRLLEPPSQSISIMESCSLLVDDLHWLPSVSGLVYEDELVKIVVEDLLKYTHGVLTSSGSNSRKSITALGMSTPATITASLAESNSSRNGNIGLKKVRDICHDSPPLPPPRAVRSHSFSNACDMMVNDCTKTKGVESRFSGSIEVAGSLDRKLQFGFEVQTQERMQHHQPEFSKGRKSILRKFLPRKLVQKHGSESSMRKISVNSNSTCSPPLRSHAVPTMFYSQLPEHLSYKVKEEFSSCSEKTLPPKYLARLVDTSGNPSFKVLQGLFLTENSICVVVFDTSRDILSPVPFPSSTLLLRRRASLDIKPSKSSSMEQVQLSSQLHPDSLDNSYLFHVMEEVSNICMQWSGSKSDLTIRGPRIVLVGTHSDEVPSSVTHRNFEILRNEIRASPYEKYVALVKFAISNSSVIERSSMNALKKFMKETVKKCCRQQVPLKWLRCVRRFQGFFVKKNYFVSLVEARKLVSEICDISPLVDPEIDEVIHFLHQNHLIMHFPRVHPLRDLVIICAWWFAEQVSAVFAAGKINIEPPLGPPELLADQEQLKSSGILSNQLLDYVWREEAQMNKDELLIVMNKMDLLCVMASNSQLVTMSASIDELTGESSASKKSTLPRHHHKVPVSYIVVPALVEEPHPPDLINLPAHDVKPILFRFKDHIPNGLFHRLLARCIQSYPKKFRLYQHAATFEFDESSLLLLMERRREICLTLHPNSTSNTSEALQVHVNYDRHNDRNLHHTSNGKSPADYSSSLPSSSYPSPISPDTCMAILMFIQATVNDLTQQWTPHLDFNLCIECNCKATPIPMDSVVDIDAALAQMTKGGTLQRLASYGNKHYIILNDVGGMLQQLALRCEQGSQVPLSASLLCWFGETPSGNMSPSSPAGDLEYVTDEDINCVLKMLGSSWKELGKTLGFSQLELERLSLCSPSVVSAGKKMLQEWQALLNKNATFFALLGALEIIQRRDIADDLVSSRFVGT